MNILETYILHFIAKTEPTVSQLHSLMFLLKAVDLVKWKSLNFNISSMFPVADEINEELNLLISSGYIFYNNNDLNLTDVGLKYIKDNMIKDDKFDEVTLLYTIKDIK